MPWCIDCAGPPSTPPYSKCKEKVPFSVFLPELLLSETDFPMEISLEYFKCQSLSILFIRINYIFYTFSFIRYTLFIVSILTINSALTGSRTLYRMKFKIKNKVFLRSIKATRLYVSDCHLSQNSSRIHIWKDKNEKKSSSSVFEWRVPDGRRNRTWGRRIIPPRYTFNWLSVSWLRPISSSST